MKNNIEQRKIFNDIKNMKYRFQSLSGFVQNDFNRLIEDGIISVKDMEDSLIDIEDTFERTIKDIRELKEKCKTLINAHIDKIKNNQNDG